MGEGGHADDRRSVLTALPDNRRRRWEELDGRDLVRLGPLARRNI